MVSVAVRAEELGFADVWVSDHVAIPASQGYPSPYLFDPVLTLGWAAAATSRIRLVAAAAQPSVSTGSNRYGDGYPWDAGIATWSETHTSAKPSSSARTATETIASGDAARPYCGRCTPNRMIGR